MYLLTLEDEGCRLLRNVRKHEPSDTASHSYRFVELKSRNLIFLIGPETPVFYVAGRVGLRVWSRCVVSVPPFEKYIKATIFKMNARLEGKVDLLDFLFELRVKIKNERICTFTDPHIPSWS